MKADYRRTTQLVWRHHRGSDFWWKKLRDFLNFTVPNARRANAEAAASAVYQRPHRLKIQIPAALRHIVGVADAVTELRSAATYIANSCHKTQIS
jgi:hypothetical protein